MSDFQIQVGGDFGELLRGFQQLEARAAQAGTNVGKGIGEGIQGFSSKSITALNQELTRLEQRQVKVAVDSAAFEKTGVKIKEVQALIDAVERQRLTIGVDDRSITALQAKLADLQNKQTKVSVDSREFVDLQQQINAVEKELDSISSRKVLIDADANSFLAITTKLRGELDALQQKQVRVDIDSQEFVTLGNEINRIEGELQALENKRTQVAIVSDSLEALQRELTELQNRQTKVSVDSTEFAGLQRQIDAVQQELAAVERRKVLIDVDANSITAITTKLNAELDDLERRRLKIDVDSQEFVDLSQKIDSVEGELSALQNKKLLITADPSSIVVLRAKLGDLQQELDKTQIGSQRFRELQTEIRKTEQALELAGQSADGLRVLDGVIQGIAFSLTNSLVSAAGSVISAIGNVVGEFGRLDTEIRKAAAAGGEQGGYDKLARAVDQVGIEAAGTSLEVAQLATELVRGGMSVDDANASLAAIVRGAEATGTGFSTMGTVVSAAIKGFGLEATDATRVVDALVTGANASAASVEGMGSAFKYAAPVASIMGVSMEELGIAIGLMTNAGISAEEAGVTLRNGLSKLASAAPQTGEGVGELTGQAKMAAEAMKTLGLDIYETDGTLKPMESTLLQLRGAFEKLDPASKVRLAANLFGGEDDGTKWLALLRQSEEEIKRMSAAMANTKGATDIARDAMQGFEMEIKKLEGTLGSIGNVFGKVASTALLPLVGIANAVAGAISGLPDPVKNVGAAMILLAGSLAGATIGLIAFNAALATTQVQGAIAGVSALGKTIAASLPGAATVAILAIDALKAGIVSLNAIQVPTIAAMATAIKTSLVGAAKAGVAAFQSLAAAISSGALLTGLQAIATAAKGLLVTIGPLALAVGTAILAWKAWEYVLGGSTEISKQFEKSQEAVSKALVVINGNLEETAKKAQDADKAFFGLAGLFRDAREDWSIMRQVEETKKLQEGFDQVYNSAFTFFQELKNSETITDEQRKKAEQYVAELQKVASAYRDQAENAKLAAVEAARAGNSDLAKLKQAEATQLEANARALGNLAQGYKQTVEPQKQANDNTAKSAELSKEAEQAVKARAQAERELNQIISQAPIRNLEAQLAVGQQLVGLSKALGDNEQSRFAITRAGLEFELQAAENRGASEQEIGQIKQQIQETDRAAMEAKYKALQQQQELELKMLELSQQKAKLEADQAVQQQLLQIKEAQAELDIQKAKGTAEEIRKAEIVLQSEQLRLGIAQEGVALLNKTQPLEAESLRLNQDTADNIERAAAEQAGYRISVDGSVKATDALAKSSENVKALTEKRKKIEQDIQTVIDETATRQISGQIAVGEKLVGLSQALAAEEQSRFDLVRVGLEYQLNSAEKRGAGEQEIGGIKAMIAANDRAAAEARYAALLQQQQLEMQMLELSQKKAMIEANLEVRKQRVELLKAEAELVKAGISGDQLRIAVAEEDIQLQRLILNSRVEQVGVLNTIQSIEKGTLDTQQKTAKNLELVKIAQLGVQAATAGSATAFGNANRAAGNLWGTSGNIFTLSGGIGANASNIQGQFEGASTFADSFSRSLDGSTKPADDIATAFTKTGDSAPAIVQGARDFASWLSSAKGFANQIADLNLEDQMGVVASRTEQAAIAARNFYYWLEKASNLPSGRWTGGPVDAGETYKVNELGQEALLTNGRLSLINAAPNSIWRAPASGTVIPAGITSRLQEQGAIPGRGGASSAPISPGGNSSAALAVEIGKLRQEVGELARKQWNVNVAMKTGPTGSQVLKQMLR